MDFVENAENLIRIDRAEREVIIGVAAIIEVEATEHIFIEQPCDDLLDVLRKIMVPRVNEHLRAGTGDF